MYLHELQWGKITILSLPYENIFLILQAPRDIYFQFIVKYGQLLIL